MQTMKLTHMDQSKRGSWRAYFDGRNDWQNAYYVGQNCPWPLPPIGTELEVDTSSKRFIGAKADTWFLNDFKIKANGAGQQEAQMGKAIGSPAPANDQNKYWNQQTKPQTGWDIPSGDLSRFASNVLGSAIAAGLIKTPHDIAPWTAAAYRAGNDLRTGKVKDFDDADGLAIHADGPDPTEDHGYEDGSDVGF